MQENKEASKIIVEKPMVESEPQEKAEQERTTQINTLIV